MSALTEEGQKLAVDALVTLFQLDATALGDEAVRYFTSSAWSTDAIMFDGNTYTPIDVEATGFEWSGQGAPPQPKLRIANTNPVISALVRDFDDLVGAEVTRIRTFWQFLDAGDTPDPTMTFPLDLFRIERKVAHNKVFVEFELAAQYDQEGQFLPGRPILKHTCTHIYRRWDPDAEEFDTSQATCPYVGETFFTEADVMTADPAADRCSKSLTGCALRFVGVPLPTRAFPGLAQAE
jgi:lambda family phage minor tail protein L